ncbi:MAG: cytochrome P450, partial [Thermanaerothrix sp.]|nr:cytochrome P450 [Thermanaerothrix sp.]
MCIRDRTWTWYLLAHHPEVEAALITEVDTVLGGRPPGREDMSRLTYTTQVFAEALRLYPPAWLITRRALAADTILGHPIPAGALIIISPYVLHRHPAFWEEAEAFRPERFDERGARAHPRFAYIPFGGGPRLCIGNQFALVEAQLILSRVLQCYRLAFAGAGPVRAEPLVTLRPKGGMPMRLIPR